MESLIKILKTGLTEYDESVHHYQTGQQQKYMMSLGGKRIRPLLTLLSCRMFGKDAEAALPAAMAVELFHNFSLVHDDIMDHAPLRRGHETVHQKWNEPTAILTGDVMLVNAFQHILKLEPAIQTQAMELFSKTAIEVCDGQMLDMNFETQSKVSVQEYIQMISLKTAVLLGCSLKLGAIVAGALPTYSKHIYNFGVKLGIAFQLQDDLLDVYAEGEAFGKQVGGDILSNKKTFLLISALEQAQSKESEELLYWINHPDPDPEMKIKSITHIYNNLDIPQQAKNQIDNYYQDALDLLAAIDLSAEAKKPLYTLAENILNRSY